MARKIPNLNKPNKRPNLNRQALHTKLTHYVGFFTIGYVLASAVFMMIQTKVALSSQLVTVLSVIIGAYIAVRKFIKHRQRPLTSSEINRLTVGSVVMVWLLTALYLVGIWLWLFDDSSREVLMEMAAQQPFPLLSALVMIFVLTIISARISIWAFNRFLSPKLST